jgi:5-methylcytosine-specific restriction protein A
MPSKPNHHCNYPGCLETTKERYCIWHQKKFDRDYEKKRETAAERGYDANWAKVREIKLNTDPLCERCMVQGNDMAADLVHHKDHNPKNNREWNLESLCDGCHREEHKQDRWGRPSHSYRTGVL